MDKVVERVVEVLREVYVDKIVQRRIEVLKEVPTICYVDRIVNREVPHLYFPLLCKYKNTCFTGTKVQMLTQKALVGARRSSGRACGGSSQRGSN